MVAKCCANCISDRYLRDEVIPQYSTITDECPICHSKDEKLIESIKLKDYFELLLGIYKIDDQGDSIVKLLKKDWKLFSHSAMDDSKSQVLLAEILDDGDIVRKQYSQSSMCGSKSLARWSGFRSELMHKNRFFPQMDIEHNRLKELLNYLLLDKQELPEKMYRARLQKNDTVFNLTEMGAPPGNLASHGRANPAGIPYLYMASDIKTAISEIRPHTGEMAGVAEFLFVGDLSLVDLRDPRSTVSPFMLADESEVAALVGDISFLEHLGDELTRPVLPSSAAVDYVPSQYLCEFIKNCGYHGVMYSSSVSSGLNVALFCQDKAEVQSVSQCRVDRVTVEVSEVS